MWKATLITVCLSATAYSQSQFQNFQPDSAPVRTAEPAPSRSAGRQQSNRAGGEDRASQRETTTPVPILKQINEHNEDGSYTYGYEAADGTFKLETRFPDGSVQGKYGYIDVNGEVKIIQYGADSMGFQPEGDLPDGIIIPPPVEGNCTDCDYDYVDQQSVLQEEVRGEDQNRFQVANRARGDQFQQPSGLRAQPSQNRGQDLDQPITPAPLPRRPAAFPPPQDFDPRPAFQPQQESFQRRPVPQQEQLDPRGSFQPTPLPQRPVPEPVQQQFAPVPAAPASSSSSGSSFSNFPARDNPARGRTRLSARPSSAGRGAAPSPGRRPTPAPAPVQQQPQQAFQSFPATQQQQQPAQQQAPIRPAFEEVNLPTFSSFQPAGDRGAPAVPRFAAAARPALTFQDQPQQQQQQPAQQLPKSALEIVDFNQLLQEFQGSRNSRPANTGFQQFPARF